MFGIPCLQSDEKFSKNLFIRVTLQSSNSSYKSLLIFL